MRRTTNGWDSGRGFYERRFVTIFGTLVLPGGRSRGQSFLLGRLTQFQRQAPEMMMLIRRAFPTEGSRRGG